ncbi:MAG TPA: M56 family metallopeptidase, partial [Pyrinomonadaceae bacterium]|nr:M56 family metallopeptidase [Pyrinomonadaceae bacterium]
MNPIQAFLAQPFTQSIGWALVHFIWQGAIVALLFGCVRASLKRSSANVRYTVACFALVLMLALPVITTFIVRESLRSSVEQNAVQARPGVVSDVANAARAVDARPVIATQSPAALPETHRAFSFESWALSQKLNFLMPWLVALWIAGVGLLSLRAAGGWVQAQRLRKRMTSRADQVWQDVVARLAWRLKVSRTVRLCESAIAEVPTVIGWLRPVILLPASALTGLSREQMEALLAHELAHIRRHDYLVNLIQTAIETLLFYHPAVWWVSREIRTEREHACDDLAVAACGDVLMYARTLAELETLRANQAPQLAVAANGGSLLTRIRRLVETPSQSSNRPTALLASVIALVTIFSIWASASTAMRARDVAVSAIERLRESYPFTASG